MALNIRNAKAEALAADVAELTGESKTQAVTVALEERLARLQPKRKRKRKGTIEEARAIALRCASLPDLDTRSPDEMLGWDENGLPT